MGTNCERAQHAKQDQLTSYIVSSRTTSGLDRQAQQFILCEGLRLYDRHRPRLALSLSLSVCLPLTLTLLMGISLFFFRANRKLDILMFLQFKCSSGRAGVLSLLTCLCSTVFHSLKIYVELSIILFLLCRIVPGNKRAEN